VYLVEAALTVEQSERLLSALLVDPIQEVGLRGASPPEPGVELVEVHPLPGVMDPVAQTVSAAIHELIGVEARVLTGSRYDIRGANAEEVRLLATRLLANPVVHSVHGAPHWPDELPAGEPRELHVVEIPIRELDDEGLRRLSREGHLFLSLDEMRAVREHYRGLEREPTDVELETFAQTWSEHCVHKTLKSRIRYSEGDGRSEGPIRWSGRPGHRVLEDGTVLIDNLLRSTVAAATHELIAEGVDWCLSVFEDNAGIIAFDDEHAVCVKVETHNHPSAIEPYGGAATGIGGCIRDIIGTGLAAKPIASTDVFCVAPPDLLEIPAGCLHPRRILSQVVAGVRDYGNRMGIPTVNGAVWFDPRYVGNPLVYCGCVGVMPRELTHGEAREGDLIVALGGRTGRDGIHGATFSSAELTDTHADEFGHAVQIGNAIEEKRLLDAILRARDAEGGPLFSAITDCGAGGFSSAVGEMGEKLGAEVHLDRAPLKYEGLTYTEIWISEAQERMVLSVPPERLDALARICEEEHVELAVLGTFGTPGRELVLRYHGQEVGRLSMEFLHEGLPTPTREAVWVREGKEGQRDRATEGGDRGTKIRSRVGEAGVREALLALLADPNIASKHWIIRQYDHEVQGNLAVKPLGGPLGIGPMDAAVIEPAPGSGRGLAIACGLATGVGDPATGGDPYWMALAAIDECVRNLVCVGAEPERVAILDNFCWPSCARRENLGALVRACEGCYDGAKAYRTPFISGKDSLNNQFTTEEGRTIEIPPTLLITGVGIVTSLERIVTMDMKAPGNLLVTVQPDSEWGQRNLDRLGGSHAARLPGPSGSANSETPEVDLEGGPAVAQAVSKLIADGLVEAAHDVSDGGLGVAIAEMLIAGSAPDRPIGASVTVESPSYARLFAECPSAYLLEVRPEHAERIRRAGLPGCRFIGATTDTGVLTIQGDFGEASTPVSELEQSWRGTLDW